MLTSKGGNPGPREKSKAGTLGAVHRSSSETSVTFIILTNIPTAFYPLPIKKTLSQFEPDYQGNWFKFKKVYSLKFYQQSLE